MSRLGNVEQLCLGALPACQRPSMSINHITSLIRLNDILFLSQLLPCSPKVQSLSPCRPRTSPTHKHRREPSASHKVSRTLKHSCSMPDTATCGLRTRMFYVFIFCRSSIRLGICAQRVQLVNQRCPLGTGFGHKHGANSAGRCKRAEN